ncbi:hypothetical protein WMY93_027044 [Mugilogobius chulae]|uniref:transketolase n=1 Tax=Mugilogobius chulae TaxID=88201 RepID=A0AAW0MTL1_9GOBI
MSACCPVPSVQTRPFIGQKAARDSSGAQPDQQTVQALRNIAARLRINSIRATTAAGSGHPTSCCSVAEIMSVLFFHSMKYRPEEPRNPNNDRFVLSKGHAAPVLYAVWAEIGFLKESDLLNLRKVDSILEGHPVPKQQFVDVATGSLGQGLGAACGMAYTAKYFDQASYRVFCLLGDGEVSEGSVWEAMAFASFYQLHNLHHVEKYQRRCEAFGWQAVVVDGHSVEELCKVLSQPRHQPLAVIAKTIKGKGIQGVEDKMGWHGKPLPKEMAEGVIRDLQSRMVSCSKRMYPAPPSEDALPVSLRNIHMPCAPTYKLGDKVSVAVGCAARDRNVVFASTFATFFSRAYDQLRMAAISESTSTCAAPTAASPSGLCFIRTSRPENNIIYNCNEDFHIGQAKVVYKTNDDHVTVIGAGVTLHEALAAAENLKKEHINIRVIDPFTIKPLDSKTIIDNARATRGASSLWRTTTMKAVWARPCAPP